MPQTEEIEFHDETFDHITEEYELPGDLSEAVFDQACSSIPERSGEVEITYEDENTGGLRALLAITHISPDGVRTELFRTAYTAEQIAPPPPEAPPLEQYEVYDVDMEMLAEDAPVTRARSQAVVPDAHPSQLAAQSEAILAEQAQAYLTEQAQAMPVPAGPAPETFLEAIPSPTWWNAYLPYAAKNYLAENAQFVAELGGYMNAPTWEKFDHMITTYILEEAQRSINISSENRLALIKLYQTAPRTPPGPGANVFGEAYQEVYDMLAADYARFRNLYPARDA